jgi:ABC-type multidrug transport system ATPase subunit
MGLASYSKGMRQKVLLCSALLHNPDILVLDEPFSGLDVTAASILKDCSRRSQLKARFSSTALTSSKSSSACAIA